MLLALRGGWVGVQFPGEKALHNTRMAHLSRLSFSLVFVFLLFCFHSVPSSVLSIPQLLHMWYHPRFLSCIFCQLYPTRITNLATRDFCVDSASLGSSIFLWSIRCLYHCCLCCPHPLSMRQSCQPWAIHICTIMSNNPWDLWNILTILTSRTKCAPNW